jgi:transcriptional regulator of acetoin/glycerol metabolism
VTPTTGARDQRWVSGDVAVPRGEDPAAINRYLRQAHETFLTTGDADPAMRRVVVESWLRSISSGIDPEDTMAVIRIAEDALAEIRAAHPLTAVMPVVRRLLVDDAAEAGLLVAVSDAAGQLLYVEGNHALRTAAESMHFVAGADWSEASAGTNAPGTALALDRPVQIFGAEHLARHVTPWSCSAAPIHDPDTGAVLGVLDVTGTEEVATPHALQLVRATVAAAEAELRIARLATPPSATSVAVTWQPPRLDVLGKPHGVMTHGSTTTRLSARHSELLLLLATHTGGLSAAELAVALSDEDQASVTIRAEVSRMRGLLGPIKLESRPYRLDASLATDAAEVRDLLARGEVRRAVAAYAGPVLPSSTAPAVCRLRDEVHTAVRATVLDSADADTVLSFADTPHGRDDYEVWEHALAVLPPGSPRRPQVVGHLGLLDRELL